MKKRNVGFALLSVFVILFFAVTIIAVNKLNQKSASAATTACPTGFALSVNGSSGTSTQTTISGVTNIIFGNSTSTTIGIKNVIFLANNQQIGKGFNSSAANYWNMPWVTQLSSNGPYIVQAEITFNDGSKCITNGIPINVQNSTSVNLMLVTQPQSWSGPMSFSFPMSSNVRIPETNFDVSNYAVFNYSTTIGNIQATINQVAQFSSGQTAGSGEIAVNATYGGKNIIIKIPIEVGPATAPLPSTSTTSTASASNTSSTTGSATSNTAVGTTAQTTSVNQQQTTAVARTAVLANNTSAQECAVVAIGKEKFDSINSGKTRPTTEEIKKLSVCFATSNYIIPSNFAPIAPKDIKSLPNNYKTSVSKLTNEKIEINKQSKEALKMSGVTTPNSTVILYVYSEPLVLVTTSDNEGNWTYTLQDPIEPGSHEVYAVVDRGDGVYQKSNPFSFIIGRAQATAENPNELSLLLANDPTPSQSNRSMYIFIGISVLVVSLATCLVALVLIKQRKNHKILANPVLLAEQPSNPNTAITNTTPSVIIPSQDQTHNNET